MRDETGWRDGFEFILQEIMRLREIPLRQLPENEWLHTVPHPSGGTIVCGSRATDRFYQIAKEGLNQSPYKDRLSLDDIYHALKDVLARDLVATPAGFGPTRAGAVVDAAIEQVAARARTERYYFPCHLMDEGPPAFCIGPVRFERSADWLRRVRGPLQARAKAEANASETSTKMRQMDADGVEADYSAFAWVAGVTVERFDRKTGSLRAEAAVQAAVDFLHVYFGARDSDRMRLGGPGQGAEQAHRVVEGSDGELEVSWSRTWPGNRLKEDWIEDFEGQSARRVADMAVALEALIEPQRAAPFAFRYIDALTWYGDAARERAPAAALLKYVAAIERAVLSGASRAQTASVKVKEKGGVTKRVKDRVAAISFNPEMDNFWAVRAQVHDIYEMRSDLVHGARSPFDPAISRASAKAGRVASDLLIYWLDRFGDAFEHAVLDEAKIEATYSKLAKDVLAVVGRDPRTG